MIGTVLPIHNTSPMHPLLPLQLTEKKIASMLKWDLNAVTVADFIHELAERLIPILDSQRAKLVEHSLTLANVCLICECHSKAPPPPPCNTCSKANH